MDRQAQVVVFDGAGQPLRRLAVPLPALRPGEVLVRVRACTLCGSDLHTYAGRRRAPLPSVLGHEIVGVVERLPDDGPVADIQGEPLRIGDRVVWSLSVGCGRCFFCAHELPQKCESLRKYGHEQLRPEDALSGGLATHCVLWPGTAVCRVPEQMPDAVACQVSCDAATVAAALRHAGDLNGAVVLVQGAGLLGLTACNMAAVAGATVVVSDTDARRLQLAHRFGAAATLAPTASDDGGPTLALFSAGRGADVVFEMSGTTGAALTGLRLLRVGGRAVWVGAVLPVDPVMVAPEMIVRRHLTLCGVHNYRPRDLAAAVEFLALYHWQYPYAEVVAQSFPLADAAAAFAYAAAERPVRVAVVP
jgi:alcohol dehydrogenase